MNSIMSRVPSGPRAENESSPSQLRAALRVTRFLRGVSRGPLSKPLTLRFVMNLRTLIHVTRRVVYPGPAPVYTPMCNPFPAASNSSSSSNNHRYLRIVSHRIVSFPRVPRDPCRLRGCFESCSTGFYASLFVHRLSPTPRFLRVRLNRKQCRCTYHRLSYKDLSRLPWLQCELEAIVA